LFLHERIVRLFLGSKSKGDAVQITWDNPEELESYIERLQAAAERLTSENRKLRKAHMVVCDKVGTGWIEVGSLGLRLGRVNVLPGVET
jgi:hypothetical protein